MKEKENYIAEGGNVRLTLVNATLTAQCVLRDRPAADAAAVESFARRVAAAVALEEDVPEAEWAARGVFAQAAVSEAGEVLSARAVRVQGAPLVAPFPLAALGARTILKKLGFPHAVRELVSQ